MTEYKERCPMALDAAGGYYFRHINAMTGEKLHSKADIAAELGYRDLVIDELVFALKATLPQLQDHVLERAIRAIKRAEGW